MPLTERDRHDAYEALQQAFGNHTDTVIELLRPDHDRLATKDDIGAIRVEMADLRTEMADLRTDLRTEMADLRTDLRTEMADLRTEFRTEINNAFAAQTRTMVIGLVSAVLLIALSNTLAVLVG
jgi:hypothetical protein